MVKRILFCAILFALAATWLQGQKVRRLLRFTETAAPPAVTNLIGRPDALVDNTGVWTTSPLWSDIDDPIESGDGSTVTSDTSPTSTEPFTVGVSDMSDEATSAGHFLKLRGAKSSATGANYDIVCELREGYTSEASQGTLIATVGLTNKADATLETVIRTLTTAEANSITDYTDLQFRCWGAKNGGGANNSVVIADIEFEVLDPDRGIAFSGIYGAETGTPVTNHTVSSVVAPADSVIFCFASQNGDMTPVINNIWFNGTEQFTLIQAYTNASGFPASGGSLYVLHNPSATTASVVVHWDSAGGAYQSTHVWVGTGIYNDSAANTYRALTVPDGSGGGGADAVVAAKTGDWVLSHCDEWGTGGTLAADHTSRRVQQLATSAFDTGTQDTGGYVAGTTTMTWSNDDQTTHIAIAVRRDP